MIIEMTVLTDEGKPMILSGCKASLIIEDKEEAQIRIDAKFTANKLIYHVPMGDKE